MFSGVDAKYSFFFMMLMHQLRTQFFNLTYINANLTSQVIVSLVSATEFESYYIGIFFNHLLSEMNKWKIRDVFNKECYDTPGFDKFNANTEIKKNPLNFENYESFFIRE